jgi:hypothetical protein
MNPFSTLRRKWEENFHFETKRSLWKLTKRKNWSELKRKNWSFFCFNMRKQSEAAFCFISLRSGKFFKAKPAHSNLNLSNSQNSLYLFEFVWIFFEAVFSSHPLSPWDFLCICLLSLLPFKISRDWQEVSFWYPVRHLQKWLNVCMCGRDGHWGGHRNLSLIE